MSHPVFGPSGMRRWRVKEEPVSWKERLEALRYVPALFRLIWRTHRGYTAAMIVLRVVRSVVPVMTFWVGKLILDSVIAAKAEHGSLSQVWRYLVLELAIVLMGEILARASSLIESLLGDLFSNAMSVQLMEHAAKLDLAGCAHPAHAGGSAHRVQPVAAAAPRGRRDSQLPRRNPFRCARLLAPVSLDTGAQAARLPPLRWGERQDGERSPDVRPGAVADRALSRPLPEVLRGEPKALHTARRRQRAALDTGHGRLLLGVRRNSDPSRQWRHQHWNADLSRRVVRARTRCHPEYSPIREQRCRAGAVPQRSVRVSRNAADDRVAAERQTGSPEDSIRIRLRECWIPVPGK